MPTVEIFDSDPRNNWLVQQFESFLFNGSTVADKVIPRPCVFLVFHFNQRPVILGQPPNLLEPMFVAPIVPEAIVLEFQGRMDSFVIGCKASVFSRLFNVDMSPVRKRSITLPEEIFAPLWVKLAKLNTSEQRSACFTEFIHALSSTPYRPDAVDFFYDKIIEKSISTPLCEILRECPISKSSMQRKFIKRTGVSPKTLARIVRLNYLWQKIQNEKAINYQELVFEGNYFDQSHFINDFKYIIGETPTVFFKRNLNTVKLFSGFRPQNPN